MTCLMWRFTISSSQNLLPKFLGLHTHTVTGRETECLQLPMSFFFSSTNGVLQIIHYLEILVDQGTSWKTSLETLSEIGTWILYDLPCYNVGSDALAIGTNRKRPQLY